MSHIIFNIISKIAAITFIEKFKSFDSKVLTPLSLIFTENMIEFMLFALILLLLGLYEINISSGDSDINTDKCHCKSKVWLRRDGLVKIIFGIMLFCSAGYYGYRLQQKVKF